MRLMISLILSLTMIISMGARAETGQDILESVDHSVNNFEDRTLNITLTFIEANGDERALDIDVLQKGTEKRLVYFQSGVEKGQGILILGNNKMFVYLPNFHKVRRIATHVKNQSFMGSDLSMDDIAAISYAPDYDAELADEKEDSFILKLIPKPHLEVEWQKLMVWVSKKDRVFLKMEYYDSEGKLRKTWVRGEYQKINGCWVSYYSKVTDHIRNHATVIQINKAEVNSGLKDQLFTKKGLIRGM